MVQIRSVSDLRNKFSDIEKTVGGVETALDEADRATLEDAGRYTHEEVFSKLRGKVKD